MKLKWLEFGLDCLFLGLSINYIDLLPVSIVFEFCLIGDLLALLGYKEYQ